MVARRLVVLAAAIAVVSLFVQPAAADYGPRGGYGAYRYGYGHWNGGRGYDYNYPGAIVGGALLGFGLGALLGGAYAPPPYYYAPPAYYPYAFPYPYGYPPPFYYRY